MTGSDAAGLLADSENLAGQAAACLEQGMTEPARQLLESASRTLRRCNPNLLTASERGRRENLVRRGLELRRRLQPAWQPVGDGRSWRTESPGGPDRSESYAALHQDARSGMWRAGLGPDPEADPATQPTRWLPEPYPDPATAIAALQAARPDPDAPPWPTAETIAQQGAHGIK